MKAPEKIYLQQYDENTLICLNKWNVSEEWSNKPCNEKVATNIEYIRKDAFIEKAVVYISEHIEYYIKKDKMCNIPLCPLFAKQSFIKDFRNYMKGE